MSAAVTKRNWKKLEPERKFRLLHLTLVRLKRRLKSERIKGPHYFAIDMLQAQARLMTQELGRYQEANRPLPYQFGNEIDRWLESAYKLRSQILAEKKGSLSRVNEF